MINDEEKFEDEEEFEVYARWSDDSENFVGVVNFPVAEEKVTYPLELEIDGVIWTPQL